MKLQDVEHLLPPGAKDLMVLLQAIGLAMEEEGAQVADLGYDFRAEWAEMTFTTPEGQRLELLLRVAPTASGS